MNASSYSYLAYVLHMQAAGDYRQKNYARGISRLKMAQTFNIRGCIFATVYGIVLPVLLLVAGIVAPIVIIGNAIQSNSANS